MKLKVITPFGDRAIGDDITDKDDIEKILASEQSQYVVKVLDKQAAAQTGAKK